jgi:hypothetical protein
LTSKAGHEVTEDNAMVATNDLRVCEPGPNTITMNRPAPQRGLGLLARAAAVLREWTAQPAMGIDDRVSVIGRGRADHVLDDRRVREADWALGRWTRLS